MARIIKTLRQRSFDTAIRLRLGVPIQAYFLGALAGYIVLCLATYIRVVI